MAAQDAADLTFLALVLWREARGESIDARAGVAHVVVNRVNNPGWWGNSVMTVLFRRLQFSSMTDPRDHQLVLWPAPTDNSWLECLDLADQVLNQKVASTVKDADSYHDISIPPPNWATPQNFITQIGRLKFYRVGLKA